MNESLHIALRFLHITGGAIGIISGIAAMFARKGAKLHINYGRIFLYSMLAMASTATYLAYFEPSMTNMIAGLLTLYLLITAEITVKNRSGKSGMSEVIGMLVGVIVVVVGTSFLMKILDNSGSDGEGEMYSVLFVFTGLCTLGVILDASVIIRGGIYGAQRIARHLWRMCLALWIATGSLFLGQPQVFPESIRNPLLLSLPVLCVLVGLIFWLVKVYVSKRFKVKRKASSVY